MNGMGHVSTQEAQGIPACYCLFSSSLSPWHLSSGSKSSWQGCFKCFHLYMAQRWDRLSLTVGKHAASVRVKVNLVRPSVTTERHTHTHTEKLEVQYLLQRSKLLVTRMEATLPKLAETSYYITTWGDGSGTRSVINLPNTCRDL